MSGELVLINSVGNPPIRVLPVILIESSDADEINI